MQNSKLIIFSLLIWLTVSAGGGLVQAAGDFQEVEKILGVKGQMAEGAYVVRFPRSDLKVSINGEAMPTALGFGAWAAFKKMGAQAMIMGDLALLEPEVNPVIAALEEHGLQVTALHNHFFYEQPRIMFMHIGGMGPKEALAQGLRLALDKTGTTKEPAPAGGAASPPLQMDTKRLEQIIGHPGQAGGGSFKITVGRPGVKMEGLDLTSSMGLNSWAGFVGTDAKAHVAGDIVMTAKEVNPVIRSLRAGGIEVVAVHNHMLDEQPRVFFLHYWGTGPAATLAQTVRTAFDQAQGPMR